MFSALIKVVRWTEQQAANPLWLLHITFPYLTCFCSTIAICTAWAMCGFLGLSYGESPIHALTAEGGHWPASISRALGWEARAEETAERSNEVRLRIGS